MRVFTNSLWKPIEGIPTTLLVLRHGEVHADDARGLYGQMDVRLSDRGIDQSRRTGLALRQYPISAVYASDLIRARYLGTEIARHHGLRPQVSQLIRERHFGDWQGLPWSQVEAIYPAEAARYNRDRFTVRAPGPSESFQDVQRRVALFLREVLPRHAGRTVAIACHSGPLRIILSEALGMPLESIFSFDQDYCCLNQVDVYPTGRVRVRMVNSTEHLR